MLRPALLANDLPLNHVMGGLNINFWPIGPIGKRSGTVFIRRKIEGDEIYKWTLREYMRYLLTKRFNLEWYIEGGRSRTGKLRPPRFGLLNYLAKAFRDSGMSDVYLVPVSLTYDQLYEVGAMAAEAHGQAKSKESLRWLFGYVRAQGQRHGVAHVNVGRPMSLADYLGQEDDLRLAVQKTAFEVCHRINEVTPVTASSLVMLAFLGIEDRALTVAEVGGILGPLVDYITARSLPTAGDVDLTDPQVIRKAVRTHLDSGVLKSFDQGSERVFYLGRDQHLVAAFYRNNTIHFLVMRAIAEMVLRAAVDQQFTDPLEDGWNAALRIRDLLKFEFFFSEKDSFRKELRAELDLIDRRGSRIWATLNMRRTCCPGCAFTWRIGFCSRSWSVRGGRESAAAHSRGPEVRREGIHDGVPRARRAATAPAADREQRVDFGRTLHDRAQAGAEPGTGRTERREHGGPAGQFEAELQTLIDQVLRIRAIAHENLDQMGGR